MSDSNGKAEEFALSRGRGTVRQVLAAMPEAAAAVRRAGFQALRRGDAVEPAALAGDTGLAVSQVEQALALLVSVGAAEVDEAGKIVSIAGLSIPPTRHTLVLSGIPLYTWCAIDALGIPAALEEDARITTPCPQCGRVIEVEVHKGRPASGPEFMMWFPTDECTHVINEFCSQANLFCDDSHLRAWRTSVGDPPGRALRLEEVEALGREIWREMRRKEPSDPRPLI